MNDRLFLSRARFVNKDGPTTVSVGPKDVLSIDSSGEVLLNGKFSGAWLADEDEVTVKRALIEEVLHALQGTRGDLHFRLAATLRHATSNAGNNRSEPGTGELPVD